jgi:hypothetical protein
LEKEILYRMILEILNESKEGYNPFYDNPTRINALVQLIKFYFIIKDK